MDAVQSQHLGRIRHLRESFAEANERLVARLRRATDESAQRAPEGGWSPAQIGWHVATVTNRFAGLMSGDLQGTSELPADFLERPWEEVARQIPARVQAPASVHPPPVVRRMDAISALEGAGQRFARALDTVTVQRGARLGITHPVVGSINVYQIGEWAIAHVIRHNKQAKGVLGE